MGNKTLPGQHLLMADEGGRFVRIPVVVPRVPKESNNVSAGTSLKKTKPSNTQYSTKGPAFSLKFLGTWYSVLSTICSHRALHPPDHAQKFSPSVQHQLDMEMATVS